MEMRTCAHCGQAKSVDEFDRRFIHKGTRITCAACRNARAQQQQTATARPPTIVARPLVWGGALQSQDPRRTLMTRGAAITARFIQLRIALEAQGLDSETRQRLCHLAVDVSGFDDHTWSEVKHQFEALRPPYVSNAARNQSVRRHKPAMFRRQQGRCYFCGAELLPLDTPYKPSSEYLEARRVKDALYHDIWSDADPNRPASYREIAERQRNSEEIIRYRTLCRAERSRRQRTANLEHLIPLSRGGSDHPDNLVIACEKCNLDKGIRTVEEFRQRPHDPVSQLGRLCRMTFTGLADAIQYESENLHGFADACTELRALKIASRISAIEYKVLLHETTYRNPSTIAEAE